MSEEAEVKATAEAAEATEAAAETAEATETKEEAVSAENGISKSKQKREARAKAAKAAKKKKNLDSILAWVVGILIAAVVIGVIVAGIVQSSATSTVSSSDFSEGLTEEGYVDGANLSKVKNLDAYTSLVIPADEVEYTDDEVETDVTNTLSSYSYYDEDTSLTVEDGDTINLDYVGYIDGVAFEGGSTDGAGTTLTIGSGSYIDDFEDQLIGSHPGDSVTVEVTFPDDYSSEDLQGKEATFECVVNSIQVTPELTDEFVAENLSEYASTAEEYKAYLKQQGYDSNVEDYITTYISDNADASGLPKSYVKHLKSTIKYSDEQTYTYYNYYFYQMFGSYMYSDFSDYTGESDEDYEADLKSRAKTQAATDVTYEALFVNNGLTISDEVSAEVLSDMGGDTAVETYGQAYINEVCIKYAVVDYLASLATVE